MSMDKQIKREVISILVDNSANVLTRISSLFGRRGYNIDSLTVSATSDPTLSRITVVFTGTDQGLHQILTQTAKLEVVKKIFTLDDTDSIYRELLLIKIKANQSERSAIKEVVDIYRGKIVDLSQESLIVEMTGTSKKLDGFIDMMAGYEIAEVCRTGVTAIGRGKPWDELK